MNMNLSSHFAQYLIEMMEVKRNSGFALEYMYAHISEFDAFCLDHFHNSQLSKELVEAWIYNTNSESRSEIKRRIRTMCHFANHLNALGISAYLCPIRIRIPKPPAPHIFTDEQLAEFFQACDSLQPTPNSRYRHIVFPTMFRVIYCCGLRSSEAGNLKYGDVNLDMGKIKILKSKGHKDRVVYFAPDLLRLCINPSFGKKDEIPCK